MPQKSLPSLSVIGLGKLGACAAAVFASKGFPVVGVDVHKKTVEAFNAGRALVQENGLQELLNRNKKRLSATADVQKAVMFTDITFVIVPTPSQGDKTFSNTYVLEAVRDIGKALRRKKARHLVVICSTVMPGAMDRVIRPCLEKYSGRRVGKDIGLCYNPEFIALGTVIRDMLNPDIILIGESDKKSGDLLEKIHVRVCDNKPVVKRMNFVNAELAKISINTFVTTKISYANMLSHMCDRLPDADCDVVTDAIGSDTRIGHKYLKAATGYGGPCFPRDNLAFAALAKKIHAKADLAVATDALNNHQPQRLMELLKQAAPKAKKVAVLGLSYKAGTPVIEESHGIKLAQLLQKNKYKLTVYDRLVGPGQGELPAKIRVAATLDDAVSGQDAVIIMVPDASYAALGRPKNRRAVTIIDCWRVLKGVSLPSHITLMQPGKHFKAGRRS